MIPRARLDMGWSDLAFAAVRCVLPSRVEGVESPWPADGGGMLCLSARSGFDLLLRALALPAGSEVLLTAVTIPDMSRIIRAHGLVPVPVDIDPGTLAPDPAALERASSPKSRALVLTHLFGAHGDFRDAIAFARSQGQLVIEDLAQSYGGGIHEGHEESDIRLFSFGPIKTETALGGAVVLCRDAALGRRMREIQARDPRQRTHSYAKRVVKFSVLRGVATSVGFPPFVALCTLAGRSHDAVISQAARSFPGDLLPQLRRRPCPALLQTLRRRLRRPQGDRLAARAACGRFMSDLVRAPRPGTDVIEHTYWLYPVQVEHPDELMRLLWAEGFDATRGSSSIAAVETPPSRPDALAPRAEALMKGMLFLPVYPEMGRDEIRRLAEVVNGYVGGAPGGVEAAFALDT